MGTVILISTVAIIVAIVGCAVIWRMDAARAEEVDHPTPAPVRPTQPHVLSSEQATPTPRSLDA